jgi:hypothetical protein
LGAYICDRCRGPKPRPEPSWVREGNGENGPDTKPSNPKDLIGSDKIPLHLWPMSATIGGSLALLEGALKYGRSNWRAAGVRPSIYFDALNRHMGRWMAGEERAPDSELGHLDHALACLAILKDAQVTGMLLDDREYKGAATVAYLNSVDSEVKRLKEKYADRSPHHYTIKDGAA